MLRRSALNIVVLAACLPHLLVTGQDSPNQPIISQDFETATLGSELPTGIRDNSGWAGAQPELSIVDTGQPGRGKALQVEVAGFAQIVLGPLPVEKDARYRVQMSLSALGNAPVQIFARRMRSPYTQFFGREVIAHEGWQDVAFSAQSAFTEPRGLFMVICKANTTLWIDSFRVEKTDRPLQPQPPPLRGNMLHNSSFELGTEGWMSRNMVTPDTNVAHSGTTSMRLEEDGLISSSWYPVGVGQEYSVSAWVRCEGKPCQPLLSVSNWMHKGGGRAEKRATIDLSPGEWHQMVMQWTAPLPAGLVTGPPAYYVTLYSRASEGVKLWVDDMMFAAGPPRPYEPRRPVELAIFSRAPYSVYTVDEPVTLEVRAVGHPLPKAAQLRRTDEDDVVAAQTPVQLNAGQASVALGKLPPGYWRFATDTGMPQSQVCEGELLVSVAPQMPDVPIEDWRLGCHIPKTPHALNACWRLGMRWNRLHGTGNETKWDHVEPEKGTWTFDDEAICSKCALGFGILANLDRLPPWLSDAESKKSISAMNYPTADTTLWEEYVRRTVTHWRNDIHYWEIMNEPNHFRGETPVGEPAAFYAHMLKAAARAIKTADPTAKVVGIGGAQISGNLDWIDGIFANGGLDACDVVAFHGYGTGSWFTVTTPEKLTERVEAWRDVMRKHGKVVPIWDSENGIRLETASRKFCLPAGASPQSGALLLPKMIATSRSAGVARLFLYSAHEVTHAGSLGLNFIFDFNNQMKSAAVPIAVAASLLEGTRFVAIQRPKPEIIKLSFEGPGQHVSILWATRGEHKIPLPEAAHPDARIINCFGREISPKPDILTITTEPVYLVNQSPQKPASQDKP